MVWVVGYCKDDACPWTEARVEEDEFTSTRVTGEMIKHTEETGHHCRLEHYYSGG
ncbi:MAG: hypothetical protein ABEI98_03620 [Halorhabdus sp.]